MRAFVCPQCKNTRSKGRDQLCSVCWLLDDLIEEHERGEHSKINVSCPLCRPRHLEQLRELGAGNYIRRITAPPLTPRKARLLLKADRVGFEFFTAHGERGSRVMLQLRDEGHLTIDWDEERRVPVGMSVTAHARHKALELLAQGDSPTPAPPASQRRSGGHADCTHERTSRARAKCRAERSR